jgi:hypothetical protein
MGSFLIMGLFGLIIASLVNIFLKSSGLDWALSVIGVLIFAGLTAWDTQKIKEMYDSQDDGFGKTEIAVPRARLNGSGGKTTEWKSQVLRNYQRRTRAADALIAGAYLAGTNTRRVRRALRSVFGGEVGKDTVSRVWRKVKGDWDAWNSRSLAEEPIVRLILDALRRSCKARCGLLALAPIIAEIRASGITTPYAIAVALTQRGIPTARGHKFRLMSQVRIIIRLDRLGSGQSAGVCRPRSKQAERDKIRKNYERLRRQRARHGIRFTPHVRNGSVL